MSKVSMTVYTRVKYDHLNTFQTILVCHLRCREKKEEKKKCSPVLRLDMQIIQSVSRKCSHDFPGLDLRSLLSLPVHLQL